ncbi:hypothetical protein SKAU_G00409850 [Synaphobranchus kaupii]|uniref:Uncharacterized protein n=1 Tax=Synaphobranchus kaupii TaxID=118154 RepID=A0A9Q1E7L0_SYNKA|nr:hypothetical protein SKAU_G00409850 [Synaphobranchus kaupii]
MKGAWFVVADVNGAVQSVEFWNEIQAVWLRKAGNSYALEVHTFRKGKNTTQVVHLFATNLREPVQK